MGNREDTPRRSGSGVQKPAYVDGSRTRPAVTLPPAFLPTLYGRLDALYGARLVRTVLFGSYARGEATEDSDVDVLVVLAEALPDRDETWDLAGVTVEMLDAFGLVTSLVVIDEATAEHDWPLLRNVRQDGVLFADET